MLNAAAAMVDGRQGKVCGVALQQLGGWVTRGREEEGQQLGGPPLPLAGLLLGRGGGGMATVGPPQIATGAAARARKKLERSWHGSAVYHPRLPRGRVTPPTRRFPPLLLAPVWNALTRLRDVTDEAARPPP